MSANICHADVAKIQDEEVLRKMWQDTEDFGRKKEIRAHMYKVREARLKDLYSSGTESQSQVSVQKTSSKSSNIQTTHADSLADHSFASLKSKEVRDSASPTRDVVFNNKINATEKYGNTGWTITSSEDTSKDGKTHTAVRTATTSGSDKIDKGVSNYAAKAEQKASVFEDGDANNYNRAVGMSDSSMIQQEASGGDENSSFKSSSKTSKSSSKTVTESKSTSGDVVDYTIPRDTKKAGDQHIVPANAKTVVYTETKTLPDGSKVTTTRYETRDGSSNTTSSTSQSNSVQKLSSSAEQSASTSNEQRSSSKYITSQDDRRLKSIADSGVDTVDYKKAIKLSEDFAKNVIVSDDKSILSKTDQQTQEIVKASKHAEVTSTTQQDTKILKTSNIQTSKQDDIIDKQICEVKTSHPKESTPPKRLEVSPVKEVIKQPTSPYKEPYEQPERRQTFKPSKSELVATSKATEGQYDTTYRAEFTNKKIHVEVSPTHDAFARSLRALTPEDLKQGGNRSLRNSNTSLRSSQSPEKMRHSSRVSPDRLYSPKRYTSPDKCYEPRTTKKYSPEKVTSYNNDTITRKKKVTDDATAYRSSTITRDSTITQEKVKSRSRSASPTTTTTSDFEYIIKRKSPEITELEDENTTIRRSATRSTKTIIEAGDSRPSSLNYAKKSKKITERSPTSPLVDLVAPKRTPSPAKEVTSSIRRTSLKEEQQQKQEKILRRSDTYEERCRQILGIPEKKKPEKNVSDIIKTDRRTYRTSSKEKITQQEIATTRKPSLPEAAKRPSKSPEKAIVVNGYPDRKSPSISEFPSQIRRSPERKPLEQYPERKSPSKDKPTISEFPSQIRKSSEKQPLEKYHERTSPKKEAPKISEFPSQIRRTPQKESLEKPSERKSPQKEASKIAEFPSQIRKTPDREPLPEYPEKKVPLKDSPKICEFPSQIRKTPERESLPKYPQRESPVREAPTISEFPSQITRTPERETLEIPSERKSPPKEAPTIAEFPSQIRKTPDREPLPEYPEKKVPLKDSPKICEFPSQIRKTPERESLPKYPQRESPVREAPTISEFPSQIRGTPEKETHEKPLERKSPPKEAPTIAEFPSQIRKTPEREPLSEYPEKNVPAKQAPTICEFPSQIRKTPEREPLLQYPGKPKEAKEPSKISEFPSQVRKSSIRETEPTSTTDNILTTSEVLTIKKDSKNITEFPSQAPKKAPKPTAEDKVLQETTDYLYKDKIPIDEPLFTKKFIAELGSDDECEITVDEEGNTKINTIDDEELYLQETQDVSHKTVKKDSPERQFIREKLSQERQNQTIKQQIDEFISIERNDIYSMTESRKSSPDLRKSPERGILKHTSQFDKKTQKMERTGKKTTADDKTRTTETVETKVFNVKAKQPKPASSSSTTKKHLVRESSDSKITTTRTNTKQVKDTQSKSLLSTGQVNKAKPLRKLETSTTPTKCSKTCCDIKLDIITKTSATDSKVTNKFVQQKPEPSVTSKRHVVTTTINVSPKTIKETATRQIKNITNIQSVPIKPKTCTMPSKVTKPVAITKKIDVENIENTEQVTQKKRIDKLVRTSSDQTVKSPAKTPTRVSPKKELNRKATDVQDSKKCITTKTILINNTVADEREIIVDLLRSTSTREDRNTVCPIPIKNNDVKGTPRYPDQVIEPDDYTTKHTPRKLSSIPIDEYEDISDVTGVTEIITEDVIKEEAIEETADESLLSVNEKVSKFTNKKEKAKHLGPVPKIERPILIIDEKLESDECLLSVSEKVNKFVNKAEKLSLGDIPERPKSPRCQNIVDITDLDENDECLMSVSDKVTHFVTTAENVKKPQTSTIKIEKTDLSTVDESLRTDECLLSVSDKVSKFITTAETLSTKKDAITPKKSPATTPSKDSIEECVTIETEEQTYTRISPQRQTTPKTIDRISPTRRTSIKEERRNSRKDSSSTLTRKDSAIVTSVTTEIETTPKTSRPIARPTLSAGTPLRSTESIRRAKALFENMATGTENIEIKRQKDILSRPSLFDAKKKPETITVRRVTPDRDDIKLKDIGINESTTSTTSKTYDTRRKLSFPSSDDECKTTTGFKSTNILLEKAQTSELDDLNDRKHYLRSTSPDNLDIPGYMKPLDRSLRPNSPHRASVTDIEETIAHTNILSEIPTPASKFGVTLRRTDSGKNFISTISSTITSTTTATTERKKSLSNILKKHEIEEIYELDILEELLETTVGYDLRRRIRSQIRLVKNLISEDKLKIVNLKTSNVGESMRDSPETKVYTKKSPARDVPQTRSYYRKPSENNFTEYQAKYIRKSSTDTRAINNHLYEHSSLIDNKDVTDKTTEYQNNYSRKTSTSKNFGNTESKPNTRNKSRETSPEVKPCRREKSPEKPSKTTSKYFQTELKKVNTNTKSSKDDKPDWVTNRPLRKIADTPSAVTKKYSSSTIKTAVTKEMKSIKPTDIITSSYGVGPMDENGSPLFGLKALRTQTAMDQSKVQGTVIRSEYYSENGQEPVGEISVTKYSTDPADLGSDEEITKGDGLLSKTTTQKFGYKDTPSYKSVANKKQFSEIENENRTKKSTTKVTRRGSVKEITQKFLDNTVDSLKSERQTYPKAGLILRTSSFKDNNASSRIEASPAEERSTTSTLTTVRTSTSKTSSGGGQTATEKGQTFLTNKSKVTGMQDIVSRMQESNKEIREGESLEDTEARSLLNKFLGSQVILSGIEGCSTKAANKTSATKKATTKVTTTITEGGKQRTVTRIFTHPISCEDIANISDEQTLRLLLDQSSDYDERRILRARLKDVMAEKEVVDADIVDDHTKLSSTSTSQSSSTSNMSNQPQQHTQGESLLLPLLQGLLDAPDATEQVGHKMSDSGTSCDVNDLRSGLIVEVQSALDKLSACLCSDATDITNERRESLLQLVSKLQANLVATSQPLSNQSSRNSERRASGQSRFNKRKQRQGRHTVGVTSEELEDARRLMEEFALKDFIPLQKQNSESAVQRNVQGAFRPVKFQPHKPLHIKNSTAKPFASSNNSSVSHTPSGASSTVDTPPTEPSESLDLLFSEYQIKSPPHQSVDHDNNKYIYKQSMSLDHSDDQVSHYKKPLHQTMSLDYNNTKDLDLMLIHQAVQQAAAAKQLKVDHLGVDSETDEDPSTLKATPQLNTVDLFHHTIPKTQNEYNNASQQPDLLLRTNPLFINMDDSASSIDKENRFNNKKLKMKRANTIDIPKPMKCYVDENESEDDEGLERRQNSYIQLRGPLNVGKFNHNKVVPNLDPKTESDKKFMAFINRQNSEKAANSMVKTSIWDNHQNEPSSANWNQKFGNIKTTFERSSSTESTTSQPPIQNSARNFWKSADDAHTAGVITYNGPKISKQSARNLQQMFEEKQKQAKGVPWIAESQNIVKGSLKVDAKIFEQSKNKIPANCTSVNMFSHAPMSAFKPIQKTQLNVVMSTTKTPTNNIHQNTKSHQSISSNKSVEPPTPDAPLFLYSPKPFIHESNYSSSEVAAAISPTMNQTPWSQTSNESRVRNIAVAKFEAPPEPAPIIAVAPIINTRKKSTEKVSMPRYLKQSTDRDRERSVPNYIAYSSAINHQNKPQGGSVHKMSGKYNNLASEQLEPDPVQRHQSAFATVPQSTLKIQPNYQQLPYTHSITYSQPKIPYNTQYYSQVDVTRSKPEPQKLDQSRIYNQATREEHNNHYSAAPKHESPAHIVYNNVHNTAQPFNYHNINRQSVIEQEQSYNSRNTPQSPYQNGHGYTSYTNHHLPHVETFVSSVSPPQMHYNDLYQRNNENSVVAPIRKVEQRFSPPEPQLSKKVPKYESQTSEESVHEYNAVSSRVMTGPVSQQAVNINQNGPKNRNRHDMDAAFNLKSTLQKIDKVRLDKSPTPPKKQIQPTMVTIMPNVMVNDKPLESLEINERGESIVTSKFHIQVKQKPDRKPMQEQALSKSDSWNQICQSVNLATPSRPSPRSSPSARTVTKSKSTHTLALPKQFEAGMSRNEMAQKKQTMEAYFAGSKSPKLAGPMCSNKTSTINRTKTSQKMSVMRQNSGNSLSRSRTLPDIVCADLLDESNVDEAFEDLFKAKCLEPTKQSFTEEPVTTTQESTTKLLSQQQVSKKPLSPFAKFKQLDRANSLNTPPTTPKTPGGGGGGVLFKFTDPQLSQSASTIKERLLHWCQMKTKEYENIQLNNFSGSWADGLAFCALIHHFLPDAFDYSKLTPNNRRYNFTLAFQIADEKADIAPLLDVEDMVATRRPDWKCVFTYVQSIYRRFKDED